MPQITDDQHQKYFLNNNLQQSTVTSDPDVESSWYGEYKKKQNEHKRLHVVGRDPFHTKQNRPQQFALRRVEPMPQNVRNAAVVWC